MDNEKRASLEQRRRFLQQRNEARAFRAGIEPAWTALEKAGEDFRVYRVGAEPSWCPDWVPRGYGRIPWDTLDVAGWRDHLDGAELAAVVREILAERLAPDDELLLVADGKGWSMAMPRLAFDRHAETILEAAWHRAYVSAPPAQWLVQADGHRVIWKDG